MDRVKTSVLPIMVLSLGLLPSQSAFPQSNTGTGAMQLTIDDEQDQPVPSALVRYNRLPKTVVIGKSEILAPGEVMQHGEATTNASGQLVATGLPGGKYAICASVPGVAFLDPCIWRQPIQVAVASGATATQTITLTKGVFLNVQVNDPSGLLPTQTGQPWTRTKLLVGVVYGNGAYHGARDIVVSGTMHSYQQAIPAGAPFLLRLFSTDVTLKDTSGAAVDVSGTGIPFATTSGQDVSYSFTVTGAAGQ